jgi:putative hydrolase of the HAD superfamily
MRLVNASEWLSPVLRRREVMEPTPTSATPQLKRMPEVRVAIFDVYGTLVISGSGDVGSADPLDHTDQIAQALKTVGLADRLSRQPTMELLHEQIRQMNADRRSDNCPKPEVDIVEIWRRVLERCGLAREQQPIANVVELAAEYEARANPTWPMPGSTRLLATLAEAKLPMGIVSNAQTFTPPLVEDLLDEKNLERGGFELDFCFFSNRFRQSKPGPRLFDSLREALERHGILPYQAVYVGNDMLNDVWAASQAGLKTAWFAGDMRSMRPRQDDPRCRSLQPDVVLTSLMQLLECLRIN